MRHVAAVVRLYPKISVLVALQLGVLSAKALRALLPAPRPMKLVAAVPIARRAGSRPRRRPAARRASKH